jgi:hypothetical protein
MAAGISFEIKGAVMVMERLREIGIDITDETDRNIATAAVNMEGRAKSLAPVRKKPVRIRGALYSGGRLRQSIHKQLNYDGPLSAAVIASVRYAWPVEMGHKVPGGGFVPAQPFMRPAAEEEQVAFMKRQEAIVRKAVGP